MQSTVLSERFERARRAAQGRWREIFIACGIDEAFLSRRAGPCPNCGGRDRFIFDDKFGAGNFFCRGCGPGDGFELIARVNGISRTAALAQVESFCGIDVPVEPVKSVREAQEDASLPVAFHLKLWAQALPVAPADPVWKYLVNRGLDPANAGSEIRCHTALFVSDSEEETETVFPAMLSRVTDAEGIVTALHRTYLTEEGMKAPIESPKRVTPGKIRGAAVELGNPGAVLGVAEGVETALAASALFGFPVWAALGASNLAAFEAVPAGVKKVVVFSDNDANFTGQAAAFELARRLSLSGLTVEVKVPDAVGEDWLDVLNSKNRGSKPGFNANSV